MTDCFLKQNLWFTHEGDCFMKVSKHGKLKKERGSRPSVFIVFECLGTLMKHEARLYEMASRKGLTSPKRTVSLTYF